jgi:SAM-dependent MidA family methyltransferase
MSGMGEFESATENAALKEAIAARIEREGGITFRDFMEMALYEPSLGYYESGRETVGRGGDYLTSPEVSQVFGAIVGRQLLEMWEANGKPGRFQVVEAGAGTGQLCHDLMHWASRSAPALAGSIDYVLVERSKGMIVRQKRLLADDRLSDSVRWSDGLPAGVEGCILSNELLDAMPVHRVALDQGRLREVFVAWDGTAFVEELRQLSTPRIEEYFNRLGLLSAEGCRAEVNVLAPDWVRDAAKALDRGFLMTFDYGYEAEELYAPWRTDGTLLCFYRHNPSNDPYARIGRQDMTSHVDFTAVRRAGEECGLSTLGLVPQSDFLVSLGILEALAPPDEGEPSIEEYAARRRAVTELIDPAGLGRVRVLVQAKGVEDVDLTGLRAGGEDA